MIHYDFSERLRWSEGIARLGVERILKDCIPGCCAIERASPLDDMSGTDYWVVRDNLPPLAIDVKVRAKDWMQFGHDDLALETWSIVGRKPGWSRDAQKRTDYILWYWVDTGRFLLLSFPALCCVFTRYWQLWRKQFKAAIQSSGDWQSECVFVPRRVLMKAIMEWSGADDLVCN